MKHIKNILLFLIPCAFLLITACKRKCQDERADNYKDNYKDNCNYSYADDWDKDIIVDSFKVNDQNIELRDIYNLYEGASYNEEDNVYSYPYKNTYDAFIDTSVYLSDEINSIEILFAIPIASEFDASVDKLSFRILYYDVNRDTQTFRPNNDVFSFIKSENVNGVEYHFYRVEVKNIKQEVSIDKYNYGSSSYSLRIHYEELNVDYNIKIGSN